MGLLSAPANCVERIPIRHTSPLQVRSVGRMFAEVRAHPSHPRAIGGAVKVVDAAKRVLKRNEKVRKVLGTRAYHSMRQRPVLFLSPRRPTYTFTQFLRSPTQFETLVGPVLDFLLVGASIRPLEVAVIGSSIGAEPYTIASVMLQRRPDVPFHIRAYDNNPAMVARTRRARYSAKEVWTHEGMTDEFVAATFAVRDGFYEVRKEITDRVDVGIADVCDRDFVTAAGTYDIVFAQNLLFNLRPRVARRAFGQICALLAARAALFIDGMDLGMRQRLSRREGLVPLTDNIREIHLEACRERGTWHGSYWGLEPFTDSVEDWERRYGTIFLKTPDNPT